MLKFRFLLILPVILAWGRPSTCSGYETTFLVTRDYRMRSFPETVTIVPDWKALQMQGDFDVINNNFFAKAHNNGILDNSHLDAAKKQDVSSERRVNDFKGLGSLLYLAMELD